MNTPADLTNLMEWNQFAEEKKTVLEALTILNNRHREIVDDLKRERDEVREQIERMKNALQGAQQGSEDARRAIRNLERDRDELAAKLVANEAYQAGLLAEFDEAREEVKSNAFLLQRLQGKLEAMREAIKEAHEALMLAPYRDQEALAKLQPFIQ